MPSRQSRSARAGLTLPVARIHRHLKEDTHHFRIGADTPVYMAGVLEYLVVEVLDLATECSKTEHRTRITPRYIKLAVSQDRELRHVFKDVTIPQGGVPPNIHSELLPPARRGRAKPVENKKE